MSADQSLASVINERIYSLSLRIFNVQKYVNFQNAQVGTLLQVALICLFGVVNRNGVIVALGLALAAGMAYRVIYLQNARQLKPAEFAAASAAAGLLVGGVLRCALWGFIAVNLYRFADYHYRKKNFVKKGAKQEYK